MNRRSFIKMLFVSAVGLAGMRPKKAFGESTLTLTQDVVYDFTNRVIDNLSPIKNLSISKLNKFCEVPGKTAGYIVTFRWVISRMVTLLLIKIALDFFLSSISTRIQFLPLVNSAQFT